MHVGILARLAVAELSTCTASQPPVWTSEHLCAYCTVPAIPSESSSSACLPSFRLISSLIGGVTVESLSPLCGLIWERVRERVWSILSPRAGSLSLSSSVLCLPGNLCLFSVCVLVQKSLSVQLQQHQHQHQYYYLPARPHPSLVCAQVVEEVLP